MASKLDIAAKEFIDTVIASGWQVTRASGSIISICKDIDPDDIDDFTKSVAEYRTLFDIIPTTGEGVEYGSAWAKCLGAESTTHSNKFAMSKSGCDRKFVKAVHNQIPKFSII